MFELAPFPPGAQKFTLEAAFAGASLPIASVPVGILKAYVGTLTFGAVYSTLAVPAYRTEPVDSSAGLRRVRLSESERGHFVAGFAPVIFKPSVGETGTLTPQLALFLGVDVRDPFDHVFTGVTLDLNRLVLVHGGVHWGRVKRLPSGSYFENATDLPADFSFDSHLVDTWERAWFVGASIDAASATKAFGSAIRGLLGE